MGKTTEVNAKYSGKILLEVGNAGNPKDPTKKFTITHNNVEVKSDFPISANPLTDEFILNLSDGIKSVEVLPKEILTGLINKKVIDINQNKTSSMKLLVDSDKGISYVVEGTISKKLFGVVNINIQKKIIASASTGEIKNIQKPFMASLIDIFSFK